ncbi:MAG: trypsin-like peptidase domain-containing protein [Halanaerobiales bacterium]|nr:trypsin-like peptidase domain-containing protein [Halanaerobiales bacterium]
MKKRYAPIIGLFIIGLLVLAGIGGFPPRNVNQANAEDQVLIVPQEQAVINAVKSVGPAVVSIQVTNIVKGYDYFYGSYEQPIEGLGSGFIFDKRGFVLTNNHVIEGAEEIKVILTDGREFTAELVGSDPQTDIAILKLDAKKATLPVVSLGNSDDLQVGQLTIAIGTPYDMKFQNTVTTGVVSALGRTIQGQSRNGHSTELENIIQTDASINPGNSGGPLLDSQGRVIGINTAIIGDAQGLGFAIPINTAKEISENLIKYGYIKRPYIGIMGQDVPEITLRNYFGFNGKGGVYVHRVVEDGPAEKSGMKDGDIILEIDRDKITGMDDLRRIIQKKGIGAEVKVLVLSDQELKVLNVKIGEMKEE